MKRKYQWVELGVGIALAVVVVLGFGLAAEARSEIQCSLVEVHTMEPANATFLTRERLLKMLREKGGDPVGHALLAVNTHEVEKMVAALAPVARCDAYVDMDGRLCVRVHQREPIARVMPRNGRSWYIARDGNTFEALSGYVAPALVVSGAVSDVQPSDGVQRLEASGNTFYDHLYFFLRTVYGDDFWRAQIAQVYVRDTLNVELVPRVGSQIVSLGGLDDFEYKLSKLRSLYAAYLPGAGLNQYETIDLRYGNQVVCKRRW